MKSAEAVAIDLFNSKAWGDADLDGIGSLEPHIPLLAKVVQQARLEGAMWAAEIAKESKEKYEDKLRNEKPMNNNHLWSAYSGSFDTAQEIEEEIRTAAEKEFGK